MDGLDFLLYSTNTQKRKRKVAFKSSTDITAAVQLSLLLADVAVFPSLFC